MNCGCKHNRVGGVHTNQRVVLLLILAGAALLDTRCSRSGVDVDKPAASSSGHEHVDDAALAWSRHSAQKLDGTPYALSALVGRPVILDFWATWCPPCRAQRDVLHALAGEYGDRLQIVAVSADRDATVLNRYVAQHAGGTHELRATPELIEFFGVEALPTLAIIDASGRVQRVSAGLMDTGELRKIVAPLLK